MTDVGRKWAGSRTAAVGVQDEGLEWAFSDVP